MRLIINTINKNSMVALANNEKVIDLHSWESELRHSEELLPKINDLLKRNNILPKDLSAILVVNGPGSYTGIRVGVSTGNALSYALKIPIVGVNCLELLAIYSSSIKPPKLAIVPIINSIHDKYYYAVFKDSEDENNGLTQIAGYSNKDISEILLVKIEPSCFVGEIKNKIRNIILKNFKHKIINISCVNKFIVNTLNKEGGKRIKKIKDSPLCQPFYINQPNITLQKS